MQLFSGIEEGSEIYIRTRPQSHTKHFRGTKTTISTELFTISKNSGSSKETEYIPRNRCQSAKQQPPPRVAAESREKTPFNPEREKWSFVQSYTAVTASEPPEIH